MEVHRYGDTDMCMPVLRDAWRDRGSPFRQRTGSELVRPIPSPTMKGTDKSLQDDVAMCVGCGLCLPHCPTFRVTSEESHSPRGRIALIRSSMDEEKTPTAVRHFLDTCVQCRGCEPACPSGVPYGRILAEVNRRDEGAGRRSSPFLRLFLWVLRRPLLLDVVCRLGAFAGSTPVVRVFVPKTLRLKGLSRAHGPRIRRSTENPDVWLFTGCVMNVWFRNVHRAALALIESTGESVATPLSGGECCGALDVHSGAQERAIKIAKNVMASMPGEAPILVDSAGCGAALKEYGELLGSDQARTFSSRVLDIHEWIEARASILVGLSASTTDLGRVTRPVIVQEPCHLRHVQKVSLADVVERFTPVNRLDNDGLCCGAGGAYSLLQPAMARAIRERTSAAIRRADPTGKSVVVTGNPGCHLHLAADGHKMQSSVEVIAEVLGLSVMDEGVR